MYQRHVTGKAGEDQAAEYLQQNGYTILDRNVNMRIAEIDIIARKGDAIYIFEVKTRSGTRYGHPFHAISRRKLQSLRRCGLAYVTYHHLAYSALALGAIGIVNKKLIILPNIDKF